jgi:hypothetical protein
LRVSARTGSPVCPGQACCAIARRTSTSLSPWRIGEGRPSVFVPPGLAGWPALARYCSRTAAWQQLKIALATEFTSVIMLAGAIYRCGRRLSAPAASAQLTIMGRAPRLARHALRHEFCNRPMSSFSVGR